MSEESVDEIGASFLKRILELWVEPEFETRRETFHPSKLHELLIVMAPGRPVEVFINQEAELVATVPRMTLSMVPGEEVAHAEIDGISSVRPYKVDPDAAWVCCVRVDGQILVSADFRRNRREAAERLRLATDFLETARLAYKSGRTSPAIENLFSAMELTAVAQMMLFIDATGSRDHAERRRLFKDWTEGGNAPTAHSRALARLAKERKSARYGDGRVRMKADDIENLLAVTGEAIAHALGQADD